MTTNNDIVRFQNLKKQISKLIKVIGVGGAGTNAVNYMLAQDPLDQVEYIVCNTDAQALKASPVPRKIQIGKNLTKGLGAGSNPEIGQQAAREDMKEISDILSQNTKMVFITAGLGGGTGTGAAPEIARIAEELGILTVAIVTMPFEYEGERRKNQALEGLKKIKRHVDSLIVINNEKIIEVYGDLGWKEAFAKSDEVLSNAVRSVTKVITDNYAINVDFNDVEAVLKNSGTALIASAEAGGQRRADEVVEKVLDSPLLNDNHIEGAKDLLLLILSGNDEITVNEISRINKALKKATGNPKLNIIQGLGEMPSLGDKISVTIIATGFAHKEKSAGTSEDDHSEIIVIPSTEEPVVINISKDEPAIAEPEPMEQDDIEDDDDMLTGEKDTTAHLDELSTEQETEDNFEKEWTLFMEEQMTKTTRQEPETGASAPAVEPNSSAADKPVQKNEEREKAFFVQADPKETPSQPGLFDHLQNTQDDSSSETAEPALNNANPGQQQPPAEQEPKPELPTDEMSETQDEQASAVTETDETPTYIEEDLSLTDENETLLLKRHGGHEEQKRTAVSPQESGILARKQQYIYSKAEKQRLKNYMYQFHKNFSGPVIPDSGQVHQINLNENKKPWDKDDKSYLNQKFD